jgi:hypothetical protein
MMMVYTLTNKSITKPLLFSCPIPQIPAPFPPPCKKTKRRHRPLLLPLLSISVASSTSFPLSLLPLQAPSSSSYLKQQTLV